MRMRRKRVIRGEKDYQTTASNSISLETFYNTHFLVHHGVIFLSSLFTSCCFSDFFYIMKWELCVILNMNFIGRISKIAKHLSLRFYKPVFIPVKSDFLDAENSIFWRLKKHIFVFTPSKNLLQNFGYFLVKPGCQRSSISHGGHNRTPQNRSHFVEKDR